MFNKDCCLYEYENVFVVDGGFMFNVLGVSLVLIIAVNVLRVVDIIL